MLTLVTWPRQWVSLWPTEKSPFPLSVLCALEGSHCVQPTRKKWCGHAPPPWGWSIHIHYLKFSVRYLALLHPLAIGSKIYISMDSQIFILYFGSSANNYLVSYWNFSSFGTGNTLCWFLCPFDIPTPLPTMVVFCFLNNLLLSAITECSRFTSHISCLGPSTSHVSKESRLLLLMNDIRNQDQGAWCYWDVVASRLSQQMKQENICIITCATLI